MKLFTDLSETKAEILTESVDGEKRLHIAGPFLMFDKPNRNGRIYPQKAMDAAVKKYTEDYISKNRALGEFNHPSGRISVDPERAAILTTHLEKDGNYYYGKAKVLSTPLGKVLQALLNDGVRVGVSSRGAGSIAGTKGPHKMVGNDFMITAAADTVHDPSVADAFVDHLMEEKEYIMINGDFMEKTIYEEQMRIKKATSAKLMEAKIMAFQNFIEKISMPK